MRFSQYAGPPSVDFKYSSKGSFTIGKIYLADDGYTFGAAEHDKIHIIDDLRNRVEVYEGSGEFNFPEAIYGVFLGPPPVFKDWHRGDVKILDGCEEDAFKVDGRYIKQSNFEILDVANLSTEVFAFNKETNIWGKITKFDISSYWFSTDEKELKCPTDFRFFILKNSIACEPMVYCINDDGGKSSTLTHGKCYQIIMEKPSEYLILDDKGEKNWIKKDKFSIELLP